MAAFTTDNRLMGAKLEVKAGTAETLTNDDYNVRIREGDLSSLEVEFSDSSKIKNGDHTHETTTPGIARATMDQEIMIALGEYETVDSGANYTPKIPYEKYLLSAGCVLADSGLPSAVDVNDGFWKYAPSKDADCQTLTSELVDNAVCGTNKAIIYKVKGGISKFNLTAEKAGAPLMMKFSTMAAVDSVKQVTGVAIPAYNDDVALATPSVRYLQTDIRISALNDDGTLKVEGNVVDTFDDTDAAIVVYEEDGTIRTVYDSGNIVKLYDDTGAEITAYLAGGVVEVVARDGLVSNDFCSNVLDFDSGNELVEVLCQADKFGIRQQLIISKEPKLSFTPLLEALEDWDFWGALNSQNTYMIEMINWNEDKSLKQVELVIPRSQMITANGSDDSGLRRLEQSFRCLRNIQGTTAAEKEQDWSLKIYGKTVDRT